MCRQSHTNPMRMHETQLTAMAYSESNNARNQPKSEGRSPGNLALILRNERQIHRRLLRSSVCQENFGRHSLVLFSIISVLYRSPGFLLGIVVPGYPRFGLLIDQGRTV